MNTKVETIAAYIEQFDKPIQALLNDILSHIEILLPDATKKISYGMPCFHWHENIIYFAAFKNHIGLYPTSSGVKAFEHELADYKTSKGAIQFPLDKPIPFRLITKIVQFRINEVKEKKKLRVKSI